VQADSPVAGLRRAADDLHTSSVQTQLAAAPPDLHLVAWVFMYADVITAGHRAVPARVIEAVDIDDLTYLHTRPPGDWTATRRSAPPARPTTATRLPFCASCAPAEPSAAVTPSRAVLERAG
jgi:hypothetical protein